MKLFGVHFDNKKDSCPVQDKENFFVPLKEARQACSILFIRWCRQNLIEQLNTENTRILMSKKYYLLKRFTRPLNRLGKPTSTRKQPKGRKH